MARMRTSEEPDYLAGAQPEVNPKAFKQLVREAFALEYQTTKDGQIADIIQRDKSRISQILNKPAKEESSSIKHLVSFLHGADHRRRIITAWQREYFAAYLGVDKGSVYLGKVATERTRRRIDRLIREGQLKVAARVALEAVTKTSDLILQEELLDRAYFALQRLDQPGQAMRVVKAIALRARSRGDIHREVGAHLLKCRILLGLTDTTPEALLPTIDTALALLRAIGEPTVQRYIIATPALLERSRAGALLTFMERGQLPAVPDTVRSMLQEALREAAKATSYQAKAKAHVVAARCHLILGERFQAEERLEKAFTIGHLKNLHVYEEYGLLMARILATTGGSAELRGGYLSQVIENCSTSSDRYHQRLAEWELARLEATLFPPITPLHVGVDKADPQGQSPTNAPTEDGRGF